MDLMGREVIARIFNARDWTELEDGGMLLEHREVLDHWTRLRTRWIFLRDGAQHDHSFEHHCYAADELRELLTRGGFDAVSVFGNLKSAPYDHRAERLIIKALKAE